MATRSKPGASGPGGADTNSLLASAASRATAGGAIGGGAGGGVGGMRPGGAPLLGGLAARRAASGAGAGGPSLSGAGGGLGGRPGAPSLARPGAPPTLPSTGLGGGPGRRLNRPGLTLASMGGGAGPSGGNKNNSPFGNFSKIVDPSGKLNFDKKAILHAEGVNFSNGQSFEINKDQMELGDVLGKGNYGEVRKVYHKPTKVTMAMKVSLGGCGVDGSKLTEGMNLWRPLRKSVSNSINPRSTGSSWSSTFSIEPSPQKSSSFTARSWSNPASTIVSNTWMRGVWTLSISMGFQSTSWRGLQRLP